MSPIPSTRTVAAAVTFAPAVEVPPELADLGAPGASLDFYDLTSLDGREGIAAHYVPETPRAGMPLVLSIHGSGGSIAKQPIRALTTGLAAGGCPVLAINTRQSNDAVNTDNFYATVRDIEAAYWMAKGLGYDRVVLHGHSLGTVQVSYFAATHWDRTTVGIVLTGMPADLPWKSRHLLIGNEPRYAALREEAVAAVQESDYDRILSANMAWLENSNARVSAQHFLTYRTEGIASARSVDWVRRVPYPILMVRDRNDAVVHDFEANWMESAASDGLSPSVTRRTLDSDATSHGHSFETSSGQLVDTVSSWLLALA